MNILILGANGFIGSHLCEAILSQTNWTVSAMDIADHNLQECLGHARFHFHKGDITREKSIVTNYIKQCDVVLPLAAIATPATYVQDPLRIFELDFEANLAVVRECAALGKRVVFPSTSEVYGMCPDAEFDEKTSPLVTGPIEKERWIYATSKQMLDRVIYALGQHRGLSYTLFRPFNWYGPRLDNVCNAKPGGSRVMTQFIGNILRGEDIKLVGGGSQQRCFMYVDDGIDALLTIIENKDNAASQQIFNIGNPSENISIRELAEGLVAEMKTRPAYSARASATKIVTVDADSYYGKGYQDVTLRVPSIRAAQEKLYWTPTTLFAEGLSKSLDYCLAQWEKGMASEHVLARAQLASM